MASVQRSSQTKDLTSPAGERHVSLAGVIVLACSAGVLATAIALDQLREAVGDPLWLLTGVIPGLVTCVLAALGVQIVVADQATLTIPNKLLMRAACVVAVAVVAALAVGMMRDDGSAPPLVWSAIAAVLPAVLLLVFWWIEPGACGAGDVKLCGVIGVAVVPFGQEPLARAGVLLLFLAAALALQNLQRIRNRASESAAGPWLLGGGWAAHIFLSR